MHVWQVGRHQSTTNPFAYEIETVGYWYVPDQQFMHNFLIIKKAKHLKLGRHTPQVLFNRREHRTEKNYQHTTTNKTETTILQEESSFLVESPLLLKYYQISWVKSEWFINMRFAVVVYSLHQFMSTLCYFVLQQFSTQACQAQ